MNTSAALRRLVALALGLVLPACQGADINIGVYQPAGFTTGVLPELFKPWAATAGFHVLVLKPEDVRAGKFQNADVLVVADADSHTAAIRPDTEEKKAMQAFVAAGGGYLGICGGCTLALDTDAGLGLLPLKSVSAYSLKKGPQQVKLQMTRLTQTILGDDRKFVDAIHEGGPVMEQSKHKKLPRRFDMVGLFWEAAGASTSSRKNPMAFTPAVVTSDYGKGRVIGFSIHPERTAGCESWLPSALRWAAARNR